ncbi:MAG: TraR/DksA family transcriptional regulator [Deltaproteobacteria bacterium]|nr:TraR/DksA family transcriptional regulator [Deltaproteobacteria bacterium]
MVTKKKEKSTRAKSKGPTLTDKNLALLQNLLLKKRKEILKEVKDLENRWEETSEPQIEVEEMAQEIEITESFRPLDETERRQIREIDRALEKMDGGRYGNCEACGKPIAMNRLKIIPWTRYCRKDAEKEEKALEGFDPAIVAEMTSEAEK